MAMGVLFRRIIVSQLQINNSVRKISLCLGALKTCWDYFGQREASLKSDQKLQGTPHICANLEKSLEIEFRVENLGNITRLSMKL